MQIKVQLPSPLRSLAKGRSSVALKDCENVLDVVEKMESKCKGFKQKILTDTGQIRTFVKIFLNENDIHFKKGLSTKLKDGDSVSIILAVAGG